MSLLAVTHPTLLDVTKRLDPNGKIDTIAEMLNQNNEMLDDMVWIEGNLPTGHRSTIRTGLPAPTWRKLYGGVQPTKSRTAQVTDNTGMLEAYAEVDVELARLNGNTAAWRLSEDRAFIEGMNQELAASMFYATEATAPEEFTGLAPRYNSLSAENGGNIIIGTGTCNASIWLVVWGPNTIHAIYPKGSVAGLEMTDKGQVTIEDASDGSNSGRMEAYRTHYKMKAGLTVRDWRYAVRIQVDVSALVKDAATGSDMIDLMTQAIELLPAGALGMGRPAFYMNRTLRSFLRRQTVNAVASSTLTMDMVAGKKALTFDGIPVRRSDSLLFTETEVT